MRNRPSLLALAPSIVLIGACDPEPTPPQSFVIEASEQDCESFDDALDAALSQADFGDDIEIPPGVYWTCKTEASPHFIASNTSWKNEFS